MSHSKTYKSTNSTTYIYTYKSCLSHAYQTTDNRQQTYISPRRLKGFPPFVYALVADVCPHVQVVTGDLFA